MKSIHRGILSSFFLIARHKQFFSAYPFKFRQIATFEMFVQIPKDNRDNHYVRNPIEIVMGNTYNTLQRGFRGRIAQR